jgi:glycosyltransferase involved in cell wall biosynthesis
VLGRAVTTPPGTTAVVVPVYGNEATLEELVARLAAALDGRPWRVRLVVDASPDDSAAVAGRLAAADARVAVTVLERNVGQHRALEVGLAAEPGASTWACLDADLQDPPEALPVLLDRLATGDVRAVFAGRRGAYEGPLRLLTGRAHRLLLARLTGLPPDAGAFLVLDAPARAAVLAAGAPSLVAAIGAARLPVASVPVVRHERTSGRSAWTVRRRMGQSARTLAWTVRARRSS